MIIFNLDGTLADCEHRRHFVDPEKNKDYLYSSMGHDPVTRDVVCDSNPRWHRKDNWDVRFKPYWKSFYEACDKDEPIKPTLDLIKDKLRKSDNIHFWSERCDSVRKKTIEWLSYHIPLTITWGNGRWDYHLKMRPIGDSTPEHLLKKKWIDERLGVLGSHGIEYVFDSDPKSINMWKKEGIFVFNCDQHGGEF